MFFQVCEKNTGSEEVDYLWTWEKSASCCATRETSRILRDAETLSVSCNHTVDSYNDEGTQKLSRQFLLYLHPRDTELVQKETGFSCDKTTFTLSFSIFLVKKSVIGYYRKLRRA